MLCCQGLSDIYMCLIRHIHVSYPTYFLKDVFCSTTYYTKQHIFCMFLNNINMFLNNICMSYNIIRHMYVMHRLTAYMWSLFNIFLHLSAAITPFVALVVQWAYQFIASSKHLNCMISTLFVQRDDVFYPLCTRAWRVLLLRNTQWQLWHLGWYICLSVCVHVVNGITTPCLAKKNALRTPSTRVSLISVEFELTHTEEGLVGVGGLVAWLEACVHNAGDNPQ